MKIVLLCIALFAAGVYVNWYGMSLTRQRLEGTITELKHGRENAIESTNRIVNALENLRSQFQRDRAAQDALKRNDELTKQEGDWMQLFSDARTHGDTDAESAAAAELEKIKDERSLVWDELKKLHGDQGDGTQPGDN